MKAIRTLLVLPLLAITPSIVAQTSMQKGVTITVVSKSDGKGVRSLILRKDNQTEIGMTLPNGSRTFPSLSCAEAPVLVVIPQHRMYPRAEPECAANVRVELTWTGY